MFSAIGRSIRQGRSVLEHPLNQASPRAALWRWLRWRLAIRLAPGPLIVPYIGGTRLVSEQPFTSVTACVFYGLGEFEDMAFLLHALRPGDLFCDVGANAGIFTVLASGAAGARTIAFEPVPSTFRILRENVAINDLRGLVEIYNEGVGAAEGLLRFTNDLVSSNHVVERDGPDVTPVKVTTLDHALAEAIPLVIKIDVEGFEHAVLRGAERILESEKCQAVLLELDDHCLRYHVTEGDIVSVMTGHGFTPATYSPFDRKLTFSEGKNLSGRNTIFIRDIADIEDRIANAPLADVNGVRF